MALTEVYFVGEEHLSTDLLGLQAEQSILRGLVQVHLPRLDAHLRALDVDLAPISIGWFLCLFYGHVQFQVRPQRQKILPDWLPTV